MREWFCVHGQMAGRHRARIFGISDAAVSPDLFDTVRAPAKYEREVYHRDSYTCRYCGLRQVAKQVLYAFEKVVGSDEFRTQGTWAYATRRAESIEAAKLILLEALERHPEVTVVHYNLACYECQSGSVPLAKGHLKLAFKLAPQYRLMARSRLGAAVGFVGIGAVIDSLF